MGKKTRLIIHTKNPRHTILVSSICSLPCMLIHPHLAMTGDRACLPVYYRLSSRALLSPRLSIHFLGSPAIVPCWQPFLNLILMRWAFHYPLRSLLLTRRDTQTQEGTPFHYAVGSKASHESRAQQGNNSV